MDMEREGKIARGERDVMVFNENEGIERTGRIPQTMKQESGPAVSRE